MEKIVTLQVRSPQNLLRIMQEQNIYMPAYCGGRGICGKCRVRFVKSPPIVTQNDDAIFTQEQLQQGWRLACMAQVSGETSFAIIDNEEDENEMVVSMDFATSDYNRYISSDISDGQNLSVAVDIGTTTLAATLIDTVNGKRIKSAAGVNHQRAFGADVISRIAASNEGYGKQLQECILTDLRQMLRRLDAPDNAPIVISANSTMEHLLQGLSCESLGKAPYTPVDISLHPYTHDELSMMILPGISTYVGADIVSGIVACGMGVGKEICLLIDLGTNGEMAIGNGDRILVASTAAGPAFEGGNISCGVAGIPGAISKCTLQNGELSIETIGGKNPIGICGTGVLEILYELLKNGLVDETGTFVHDYIEDGYPLTNEISFMAKDVREVQLAKAAIRAGAEVLIAEYGLSCDQIDKVYLAGGFGQKIDLKKAIGIGLLPEDFNGKIEAVGNSSLAGAERFLTQPDARTIYENVANIASEVSLASHPLFQDIYMEQMFFPEMD